MHFEMKFSIPCNQIFIEKSTITYDFLPSQLENGQFLSKKLLSGLKIIIKGSETVWQSADRLVCIGLFFLNVRRMVSYSLPIGLTVRI